MSQGHPIPSRWAGPLLVGVATCAAAILGIEMTRQAGNIASLWLANAVLLAALATQPLPRWHWHVPAFVLGNAAANLWAGDTLPVSLGFGAINATEAIVAALLVIWRCGRSPRFERVSQILCFAGAVGFAAPLVGATIGAGFVALVFGAPYSVVWPTWFTGDVLGNLTLGPLLILLLGGWADRSRLTWQDAVAMLWPACVVAAASLWVFTQREQPIAFLLIPMAVMATHRVGPLGAALAVVIVSVIGGVATALTHGPMSLGQGGMAAQIRTFQLFIMTLLVCTLPLAALLAERRALEGQLRAAAMRDALTGLTNRAGLMRDLSRTIARAEAEGTPLSIVVVDIDHFKSVNDSFGHLVGDHVLEGVAAAISASVREGDICARLGGEEFVVLMPGTALGEARLVSERLREAVHGLAATRASMVLPGVTVSAGAAQIAPGETINDLLTRADRALYAAKSAGRNRVELAA